MNIIMPNKIKSASKKKKTPEVSELIEQVYYKTEPIRTWTNDKNWKAQYAFTEILSNFGEIATTPEALDALMRENRTLDLFSKMLSFAVQEVERTGTPASINLYLKDISNPKLIPEIIKKEAEFWFNFSKIIIEVLEYNYWKLDDSAIKNLIALREMWFHLAIDDFNLEYEKNNLSFDNLAKLLIKRIIPKYVKIDWKYLGKIFQWEFSEEHLRELRLMIKFFKAHDIKVAWEWIWNTEEWYKAESLWIELYQWKFLNDDFVIEEEKKIKSFRITDKARSFRVYTEKEKEKAIPISIQILTIITECSSNTENILVAA